MKNILDDIKIGFTLYNTQYEFIGKTGGYKILNIDGSVKWIQLLDNSKYNWIYGNLTKSYKRGFVIEDLQMMKD
jgi:hypothetical protein